MGAVLLTTSPCPPLFERLLWRDAETHKPDSEMTVLCWGAQGYFCGFWDDALGLWIGGQSDGTGPVVTHWSDPGGPDAALPTAPADLQIDAVRAALQEALQMCAGWVTFKCPPKHTHEHFAAIQRLHKAGGL